MLIRPSIILAVIALLSSFLSPRASVEAQLAWDRASSAVGGGHIIDGSLTLADLDDDGQQEILVGTTRYQCSGTGCAPAATASPLLVVLNSDGSLRWSVNTGAPIRSTPAVGDIDGDGQPEIVVGVGGDASDMATPGGVLAYDGTGGLRWRFETQDYAPQNGFPDGVYSSPALCDVDGNGTLEIAFGSWDQRIYLLDHQGRSLWDDPAFPGPGYFNADSIWSSPACADLGGDSGLEIIIGADITGGGIIPDGTQTQDGGFLYVFDRNGGVLVRRFLPEAVYSSPAVGDLNGDGQLEIAVGTSYFWWREHGQTDPSYVYAFDTSQVFSSLHYSDPSKLPDLPGWPQPTDYPGFSSPALADLDGEGGLEVVIGTGNPFAGNGDSIPGAGSVYAWHGDGQLVDGWPVHPENAGGQNAGILSSPVIADVDSDSQLEVLFSHIWDVQVYEANGVHKATLPTLYTVASSPAVGDADGDGQAEVWIGGSHNSDPSQGFVWRFESDTGVGSLPWPMFRRNPQHTGLLSSTSIATISPQGVDLMEDPDKGLRTSTQVEVENTSSERLSWEVVTASDLIEVSPATGAINPGASATMVMAPSGSAERVEGWIEGTAEIELRAGGRAVTGGPLIIPVRLYVGEVHQTFLPSLRGQ